VITDKNGNVTSRRDFLPFGEELTPDGTFRSSTNKFTYGEDNVRKRFTGYEKDQETGLDFAEARYYNNVHGRFTAVDPLLASGKSGNPQSFNRYAYTMNQPLTMTDKTGLQTEPAADQGDDEVIDAGLADPKWSSAKEWYNWFINFGSSSNTANRFTNYTSGGEQGFEQRVGSSRVSRDITTIANPTTAPAFKGFNSRYEKIEPYVDAAPVLGSTARLGKSIWLGGNGSKNKLEVATNGALFTGDFITSFSGIAGGGIKAVAKSGFRAAAEGGTFKVAIGITEESVPFAKTSLSKFARERGATTYVEQVGRSFDPDAFKKLMFKADEIHFNTETFNFHRFANWALKDGQLRVMRGNSTVTNWEFQTVLGDPILRPKIRF
jgi:RHS repeat-associated protein